MTKKNTNQNLLSEFIREEYQSLKGYVRSRLGDSVDRNADDLIQDVALRVLSRPEDAIPINNIGGFVYYSLKNRIIDVLRTKKYVSSNELLENELLSYQEDEDIAYINMYSEKMIQKLRPVILSLKPQYSDIIIAIDFEGYSYKELSEKTGIPMGTLMSRRHRALAQLNKKLKRFK
ncbi:RNA polymerase sigma factor [Croceivirga lutea]|uniref:RNA polymerase sigma factor n=1 Tax=Croceivirga lutea TaxID=1775167 RepID=UPI00163A1C93|nr:RNA polymerase sigma factor [Croceivirga lutea]GGG40457.1 RNA polymerase sigma factor [Croceivirga lutea]